MRARGRARTDPGAPQAHAICDRCGARYNLIDLVWDMDWRGPKIQNLRFLVCMDCQDTPQPNGQRTFILPSDPVPVQNARPEMYVPDSQPLSALNANPLPSLWQYSNQIGNMIQAAGVPAAFDGNVNKPSHLSAAIFTPNSSYNNYVGINWTGLQSNITPSSLQSPNITHTLSSYTITGPNDAPIGATDYVVQGSPVDAGWGSWTTLASGTIAGTNGEVLSGVPASTTTTTRYQFHRAAFLGGAGTICVSQVSFSVSDGSSY